MTKSVLLIPDVIVAVFSQNVFDTRHRMIHYLRIKRQTLFIFQFDEQRRRHKSARICHVYAGKRKRKQNDVSKSR